MNQGEHKMPQLEKLQRLLTTSVPVGVFAFVLLAVSCYAQTVPAANVQASVISPIPAKLGATAEDKAIRPFRVNVPQEALDDLRRRIVATRWPDKETVADQSQGIQLTKLQELVRYVLALLVVPLLLVALCSLVWHALLGSAVRWRELISSFALTLVPLGFSMWVAHLVYHFLTGAAVLIPVSQRVADDLGSSLLGQANWASAAMLLPLDWLPSLQILLLDGGLLLTIYAGWRVAQRFTARARGALSLLAPWAGLAVLLYAAGVWIVFQPMEMRGLTPGQMSGMQNCPMSSRMPGMQH